MSAGNRWTHADVKRVLDRRGGGAAAVETGARPARAKFGNIKVPCDGHLFDSKREMAEYLTLKSRQAAKQIRDLEVQPVYEIFIDSPGFARKHIGVFTPDFRYIELTPIGDQVRVIDVKSKASKTEAYQLRKSLVEAIYHVAIVEVF